MSKVVCVVQARMGSTRLPGKVLQDIAGATMLSRVLARTSVARTVDQVHVATSVLPEDNPIELAAREAGFSVTRGSPTDLLDRYLASALDTGADILVRVTSDCPLIDPDLIDLVVTTRRAVGADLAANNLDPRSFPRGLDAESFTTTALERANKMDPDPGTREHVTPFIRDSGLFNVAHVRHTHDLSHVRWTVDTREDLAAVRALCHYFDGEVFTPWLDLLAAWQANPEWASLNGHIKQKPVVRTRQSSGPVQPPASDR